MGEVIDFHVHIYPDELAEKVISGVEDYYGVKRRYNATLDALLKSLEKGHIAKAVILPIATKPEHARLNSWYADLAKISAKLIPFGSIHPANDLKELEKFPDLGLRGLKIQPNALRVFPSDKGLMKFYEAAEEMGLIVIFHAGDEESFVRGEFSQPEHFVPVLKAFPNLKTVLSHLGGFRTWDKLDFVLGYPNVYYDTAHIPGNLEDKEILKLIDKIGIEKVIFGTDFPFADHEEERQHMQRLLGDRADAIFTQNPVRLLTRC